MSKQTLSVLTAAVVAAALAASPVAQANHKTAKAVAIAIGATALVTAAAAAANADHDADYYDYSHGHSLEQNAVAACLHRAQQKTERDGGDQLVLRDVDSSKYFSNGTWKVRLDVFQYGPRGRNKAKVQCVVQYDRVIDFNWLG